MYYVRKILYAINEFNGGAGCIEEVPAEIKELGLTKALIVTDKVLNQIGLVGELTKLLEQNGIQYAIYDLSTTKSDCCKCK